jgi:polyketide synthase 5
MVLKMMLWTNDCRFKDVMRATGGKGVHVVLNSLAGQHQQLGLEAMAPGGRFIEIGKMDIYK